MTAPLASTGLTGQEAAEQSRMELQAKLNGLGGLNGRKLDPAVKAKKLREACEGFESIFIQKMWQEMRNTIPKGGLLQGREERFWQDMYDQELSKSMTKAGGIGLADMMYEQLSRNLVSASRSAAGSMTGAAFVPAAAPLVPQAEAEDLIGGTLQASAASIYESEAPSEAVAASAEQAAKPQAPETAEVAEPAQAARPLTAAAAPVQVHYSPEANTLHNTEAAHKKAADLGQTSGLAMAQKARRDAGDKLSSRAVRPAQAGQKIKAAPRKEQAEPLMAEAPVSGTVTQAGMKPGSPEALKAALEQAKTGSAANEQTETQAAINLHNLVASAQARNAMLGQSQPAQETAAAEQAPTTRRVRKTTNIPQRSNSRSQPKQSDAIRMLNVDNVGVNSKAGQGLKAYHAQQEADLAARQATQTMQPAASGDDAQAQAGSIAPLRPTSQAVETAPANYAIPPLRATSSAG